jgi:Tfp pilus assembly protein PilX
MRKIASMNPTGRAPARPVVMSRNQRGIAMVIALMVLTSLSVLTLLFIASASVDRRMGGDSVTKSKALHYAEAGVAEALARIQSGSGPDPAAVNAARKVVQVLNASTGGVAGADTILLATGQPAGGWLPYSTATSSKRALTIEFRTDAARTLVYKYNKTQNPPIQTSSGLPIYRITSIGTVGTVSKRLVVEAVRSISYNLRGSVVSGINIKYTGDGVDCGYNHSALTPYPTALSSRTGAGGCDVWETGTGDLPGTLSYGTFVKTGPSLDYGVPPVVSGAAGFYNGPWEIFGMTQAQFFAWVGAPVGKPAVLNGVYYVDNDATRQNQSCNISYAGAITGSGILYVDGDLTLNNNFHFKGLVYCEGDITASNSAWILGALIARGRTGSQNNMTGPNTFLLSSDAIANLPGAPAAGAKMNVISWKEVP